MGLDKSEHRSPHKSHGQLLRRQSSAKRRPSVRRVRRLSLLITERMLENAFADAQGNIDRDLTPETAGTNSGADSQKTLCDEECVEGAITGGLANTTGPHGSQPSKSSYKPPSCEDDAEDAPSKPRPHWRLARRTTSQKASCKSNSSTSRHRQASSVSSRNLTDSPSPIGSDLFSFKPEERQEVDTEAEILERVLEHQQTDSEDTLREPYELDQEKQETSFRSYIQYAQEESPDPQSEMVPSEEFPMRPIPQKCEKEAVPCIQNSSTITESKPPKRTLVQHVKRRARQVWKLIKNPKADVHHPYLPKGLDLRIKERDPIEDQWRRRKNPKPPVPPHPKRLPYKVQAPELRFRFRITEDGERIPVENLPSPAPERVAPAILPHKSFEPNTGLDPFFNPMGGEVSLFHETSNQRAARVDWDDRYRNWRGTSDNVLRFRPIPHLNNPSVGRAPPLAAPTLENLARRAASRGRKTLDEQKKMLEIKPRPMVIETEPGPPTSGARPHQWDNWMLKSKRSVSFSKDSPEDQRAGVEQKPTGILQDVLEVQEPITPIPTVSLLPSLQHSVSRRVSGEYGNWFSRTSQEPETVPSPSSTPSPNSGNSSLTAVLDVPPPPPPKDVTQLKSLHSLRSSGQRESRRPSPALSNSSRFSRQHPIPPPDRLLPPLPSKNSYSSLLRPISDVPQVEELLQPENLNLSPAFLGNSTFSRASWESRTPLLERPLPPTTPTRPFSFIPGQDDIAQVTATEILSSDEPREVQSHPEITELFPREEHNDYYYSDSNYDDDRPTSEEIKDQFGSSNRIRAAIPDHSSWRPPSTWGQSAEDLEVHEDIEAASHRLSTTTKHSSIYWANLYSTPGNPFENAHPNREEKWKEAEMALLGMGPKPTRASAIPPEEIIAAILGISGNEQDQKIDASPPHHSKGKKYFPHYDEIYNVDDQSGPSRRMMLLKNDNDLFANSNGIDCSKSTNQRGVPRSDTENFDLSEAHSAQFFRFYSNDGKVQNEMLVNINDQPPLDAEINVSPGSYTNQLKPNSPYPEPHARNHSSSAKKTSLGKAGAVKESKVQREIRRKNEQIALFQQDLSGGFTPKQKQKRPKEQGRQQKQRRRGNENIQDIPKTTTDSTTQWSPSRGRVATDALTPSGNMIMETEDATDRVRKRPWCPVHEGELFADSPASNQRKSKAPRIALSDATKDFRGGDNNLLISSDDTPTSKQLHRMNGDRVLRHERRHIGRVSDCESLGGNSSDERAALVLQSTSIDQQTSLKGRIQATNIMSPRPISAPAFLPSLEEHIEHVEHRLRYWGGVFEDAVHPEAYDSCYCGFLVNPERVHKTQTAVNTRLEALKNGVLPPFITGGNSKLVTTSRPQLPSKYFTRPKKTISPSTTDITLTTNNKFVSTHDQTGTVDENEEEDYSPSLIKYWEASGLTMDGSPDAQRLSGQNVSHTTTQQSTSVSK